MTTSNLPAAIDRLLTNPAYAVGLLRRSLTGHVLHGAATLLLAGIVGWRELKPREVKYFASNGQNDPYPILPLDRPVLTNPDVLAWTSAAVVKAYSLDFVHYREDSEAAKANFEPRAWDTWAASFIEAKNLAKLVDAKMVMHAVPRDPPVVKQEGVVGGRYVWKVQFPMVLSYENTNGAPNETLLMEVLVVRTADPRFRRGIAVAQLVARPWLGEPRQPPVVMR